MGTVFLSLSNPEPGWTPPLNDYFSDELSQSCGSSCAGCLGAICNHFPSVAQAALCLALSLLLFLTRQQMQNSHWLRRSQDYTLGLPKELARGWCLTCIQFLWDLGTVT